MLTRDALAILPGRSRNRAILDYVLFYKANNGTSQTHKQVLRLTLARVTSRKTVGVSTQSKLDIGKSVDNRAVSEDALAKNGDVSSELHV